MDHTKLPQDFYGVPIPQELTDDELGGMRTGVENFMSNAFSVSKRNNYKETFYFYLQKGPVPWEKIKSTTWEALQRGDDYIMAGLCATIFLGSPAWKKLAIETGTAGLALRPVVTFAVMRDWFAHNHVCRKSAENLVMSLKHVLLNAH